MNWYLQSGENSDIVKSTRVRLARNLNDYKFNVKSNEESEIIENKIKDISYSIGYNLSYFKLKNMDDITKMSLVEKNIISLEFAKNQNQIGSILINDDENICIMINEEDHIRIQVFNSGLDIKNTLNLAKEIDEKIDGYINYAKSKKYGYLTACPTNLGTGARISVMLHLPALVETGNIRNIIEASNSLGLNIRGVYGENSKIESNMFQISNKQTLGITEEEIAYNVQVIAEKIIEQERKARKFLAKDSISLEDKIYRSYGLLSNCKKISYNEANDLLSIIKLGTDMGILKEMNDFIVLKLYLYIKPANLQKYFGSKFENVDQDIKRAEIIKIILNQN